MKSFTTFVAGWLLAGVAALGLAGVSAQAKPSAAETSVKRNAPASTKSKSAKVRATQAMPRGDAQRTASTRKRGKSAAAETKSRRAGVSRASTPVREASYRNKARTSKAKPRRTTARRAPARVAAAPAKPTVAQLAGLRDTEDPLDLKSASALVVDQDTNEVLFSKNPNAVLPIASLTKLMTALVVTEAALPLDELLTVTEDDIDTEKGSGSRLRVGTQLSRGEMLHLALMSSENRAANALGRHYPGGASSFVAAMNAKARLLGMMDTHYVEPTGLSSQNRSSARDLARLVSVAYGVPLIRELSTSAQAQVQVGERSMHYRTTNRLLLNPSWDIGLQKTGYISEAGRCLVMQASLAGRKLIMVLLDSAGKYSRLGDAERIRKWVSEHAESGPLDAQPAAPATQPRG